jgi:precorrin-2 dehydrogenase/sirohydrochlorin ferrochelatase
MSIPQHTSDGNLLFPVFFRLDKLHILVVGGGAVGLEKLTAIYKNSPYARATVVAPEIRSEIVALAEQYSGLTLKCKPYEKQDLEGYDLVIAATCIGTLNEEVRQDANACKVLCNIADTPESCDFYMCSVVQKGDLKIAISTNGKSPTFAKRMRELLEEVLPEGIQAILDNLMQIRNTLKGDFDSKVKKLDEITSVMKKDTNSRQDDGEGSTDKTR